MLSWTSVIMAKLTQVSKRSITLSGAGLGLSLYHAAAMQPVHLYFWCLREEPSFDVVCAQSAPLALDFD